MRIIVRIKMSSKKRSLTKTRFQRHTPKILPCKVLPFDSQYPLKPEQEQCFISEDEKLQINYLSPKQTREIIKKGLIISGNIGKGKSVLAKFLMREILKTNPKISLRMFDVVHNWKYKIYDRDIISFVIPTKDKRVLLPLSSIVYDMGYKEIEDRIHLIKRIMAKEYYENEHSAKFNKINQMRRYLYIIEESNVILNTKTVKGFFYNFVCTARNYNLSAIYIMQRLADSSTKIVERIPNYAFAQSRGQNDLRKIRAMTDKETTEKVKHLPLGDYMLLVGEEQITLRITKEMQLSLESAKTSPITLKEVTHY